MTVLTSTDDREPAIWTDGLAKNYGNTVAVDDLHLEIAPGEVFGLLGPNGAGKTTTILMLLGLSEPSAGQARVVGLDPTRQALEVKRRVGYVPDNAGFYGGLTGQQNLEYTAQLNGLDPATRRDRIASLLDEVGLAERADEPVRTYSHGMRQRLGIADALLKDPEVLILDEPTLGLDPRGADQVLDLVNDLASQRSVAVLLASHLLGQVQVVCSRVGIFVDGRMVASGTVDELAAQHGGRLVVEVQTAQDDELEDQDLEERLRDLPGIVSVHREGELWLVGAQHDARQDIATRLQEAGLTVVHLRQRSEELGAIYRRYFAEEGSGDTVG
ncbi:ABC transporter ATP-binding protein [Actinobacteria bacterium YIM 96077]|uniref:ABC transporter ATP-binding protein n=1 Tax=Phytoactinopolyspora halophila TaxID=1981511 RepID=A0A329R118_9ACTN|nr:ABC transporter ATP-binding protein [Phytoactinopolyspora halophila]AYY13121.1 ABC transporter ATP-binding protein [Actinobacteria bacterium YIM 96077]RAW17639.1 ABC transporter ATP-binding protein [Phytoactinopolyspora halophila]